MSTQLIPRPVALAKLLELGDMPHTELAIVCGWPSDELTRAAVAANRAGLVTWGNAGGTRWYRAGASERRARAMGERP